MTEQLNSDAPESNPQFLGEEFSDSELVLALVGAVGTNLRRAIEVLKERLKTFNYSVEEIRVSSGVIGQLAKGNGKSAKNEYERIAKLMDAGNDARRESGDNSILALGVAAHISGMRDAAQVSNAPKQAYIINSLKHPEEVSRLRQIYPRGFYLVGVHADRSPRVEYLIRDRQLSEEQAVELMNRDEDEHLKYGQRTSDTFHLADFFVHLDDSEVAFKESLWRILDLLFASPFITPTFDEFAMFTAFTASLRSADLSRQVGAVVARDKEIVAVGANDCPSPGGGLYWPELREGRVEDVENGRDYKRGFDSNKIEQTKIIDDILERASESISDKNGVRVALEASRISDLTEYGRIVHAEMEALLSCARSNASTRDGTIYCTTFPCHNCAKHIVAAGIKRVVYVEPYPKSKALELHNDAIATGFASGGTLVKFVPFVGVGPRPFLDLFSMRLGAGYPLQRKNPKSGYISDWDPSKARLRVQMIPKSYLDLEETSAEMFNRFVETMESSDGA